MGLTHSSRRAKSRLYNAVIESLEERRLFLWHVEALNWMGTALSFFSKVGGDPVNLASGSLILNTTDIQSTGLGSPMGVSRSWSNNFGFQTSGGVGNGWTMNQHPQILEPLGSSSVLEIVTGGSQAKWFETSGGSFKEYFDGHDNLSYNSTTDIYTLTDQTGNQTAFYGFSNSSYGTYYGTFASYTPASGAAITVESHNAAGAITEEDRSETVDGVTTSEALVYTYFTSGNPNAGELETAKLNRSTGSTWTTIRQSAYSYYGDGAGDTANGNTNDLRTATVEDGSGNVLSEDYYRYYIGSGSADLLKYEFTGPDFARLQTSLTGTDTPFNVSDGTAAPFATLYLTYNSGATLGPTVPDIGVAPYSQIFYQVATEYVGGAGATDGGGTGLGEYTFTYGMNSSFAADLNSGALVLSPDGSGSSTQFNRLAYTTVETTPGGLVKTYDMNYAGETTIEKTADSDGSDARYTYTEYNAQGRVSKTIDSAGISSINMSAGTVSALSVSSGDFTLFSYYSGTSSAGESTPSSADGYLETETTRQGAFGVSIALESLDYRSHTANGATIYYVADDTVYQNTNGSGGETTSYQFNYSSSSFSPSKLVTTLPTITTAQNGPNSASTDTQLFTADGQVQWELSANGNIAFDAYNVATGALTLDIQDLTAADCSYSGAYGTSPWTIPSSDGLVLATQYTVDDQGRTTQEITPNGNVTDTTYDDINHETRVYPGWHYDSSLSKYTATGPVQVMRDDWAHGYVDSYSYVYSPATGVTVPQGNDSTGTLTAFTRDITNTSGQVTEEDRYYNVSGVTYSTSSDHPGSLYYATDYAYDAGGNQDRVLAPTGTITRTVFNPYDEPTSTWIGVDDTPSSGNWSPSNLTGSDMVELSAATYDSNGNQTESVQYPGGGAAGRATLFYHDFRHRLIAEMDGAVETSTPPSGGTVDASTGATDTFVTYYSLDNLGEVIETDTYNSNGTAISFNNASTEGMDDGFGEYYIAVLPPTILAPANGSSMVLVTATAAAFDNQGNVFSSTAISVNPSNHSEGSSLTTNNYYDADGNLIATISPTGAATKYAYNGADWNTFIYSTDGGQINNASNVSIGSSNAFSSAASISGDIVLSQSQKLYDNDGNIIETISKDRFGTDSTGSTGTLGTPTTGVEARVSYSASYYDAADRDIADVNVGTNGGSTWTPPAFDSISRSNTELVTSYVYDPAGNVAFVTDPMDVLNGTGYDALGRTILTVQNWTPAMGPINMGTLGTLSDSSNIVTAYTYDGDDHVTSMTAVLPSGETSQTTTYVYGVTTAQGSTLDDNDLLATIEYPDPVTGAVSAGGWTYGLGAGVAGNGSGFTQYNYAAPDGTQVAFLQNTGAISQAVTFAAGTYTLSFSAAQRDVTSDHFEVLVDGTSIGDWTVTSVTWSTLTANFTVAAGRHTITFQGLETSGDHSVLLDSVSISGTGAPTLNNPGFESPDVGTGSFYDFWYNPPSSSANESYTYDNTGEQTSYIDRNGTVHVYSYDLLGRTTADTITGFGITVDQSVVKLGYTYNINGQLSTATSYNASSGVLNQVLETYDGFGNLASDAQAHSSNVSGGTPTVSYSHDAANDDRLTSIMYPNDRAINYNYSSGLDSTLSRLSSMNDSSGSLQTYTYLGLNTPVTLTDGNGDKLTYGTTGDAGLDQFGRVINQNWQNSSGTSIDDFQYGYDANSNVLYRNNTVLTSRSEVYTYDSLDRLTNFSTGTLSFNGSTASISSPTETEGWNLNAIGDWNSNTLNGTTTSRTYSAQNQVTTVGSTKLSYDANGNLLWDQTGQIYIYNGWNQLVRVLNSSGTTTASYTYDALSRRITTTESGTTDNYFDGQNLVMQQTSSGTVTGQFVWGSFYVNQLVQETNTGGTFYVHQDANWNVTSISNSSGGVVERYQYDPYGGIIVLNVSGTTIGTGINNSTINQIFGFQAGWTSPITGLVHFQRRDLNGTLGWIEQDPDVYRDGPNRYQLTLSNPVSLDDPSGLWSLNRWLYTGDGNASDEVYNAATNAGGDEYIATAGTAHQGLQALSKVKGIGRVAAGTDKALGALEGKNLHSLVATGDGTKALNAELAYAHETSAKSLARLLSQKRSRIPRAALTAPTPPEWNLDPTSVLGNLFGDGGDDDNDDSGSQADSGDQPPPDVQQQMDDSARDEGDSTDQTDSSTGSDDGDGLHRPYIRDDVRQEVEDGADRAPDGRPIDPNTQQPIDGTPDLGHKKDNEFWREKEEAEAQGLTQQQFNDRMNDPSKYQLEDPSSNRSHKYEQP